MDPHTISFCDKTGYNICNDTYKGAIVDELQTRYGIQPRERSIRIFDTTRHNILLQRQPYFMSLKSIGNTYLLYLTQRDGVPLAFLIDKKILRGYTVPRIIMVRYRFAADLYKGTVFEGDLIKCRENSAWKFVLSDMWIKAGKDIRERAFTLRMQWLRTILVEDYHPDPWMEPTGLYIKQYFPYTPEGVASLRKVQTNYQIQGICFTHAKAWKPTLLMCIDVKPILSNARQLAKQARNSSSASHKECTRFHLFIGKGPSTGLYQLYCHKMGKMIKHSIARVDGLACLRLVREILLKKDRVMVECEYHSEFEKFIPKLISTRTSPDEYTTILEHIRIK